MGKEGTTRTLGPGSGLGLGREVARASLIYGALFAVTFVLAVVACYLAPDLLKPAAAP